jgi:hypothetical protein
MSIKSKETNKKKVSNFEYSWSIFQKNGLNVVIINNTFANTREYSQ